MSFLPLAAMLLVGPARAEEPAATGAVVTVNRSKEYRQDQRPYKYYKQMKATWTVGRVATVAGVPIAFGSYLFTQSSFNRDPSDSGAEGAGYLIGTIGTDLSLIGPPVMLFSSLSAIPALKKHGLTSKPTMGLIGAGFYAVSMGVYAATLSSYQNDPTGTSWKALGVGGTVAWGASAFFANSQVNNTHRAGVAQTGE